jgi:hypothetical protein
MFLKCLCGNVMTNTGYPNSVEHLLVSTSSQEKLQDLVDEEVTNNAVVDMWPEHWEESGSAVVWKCYECERMYFNAWDDIEKIIVYKIEQQGIDIESRTRFKS